MMISPTGKGVRIDQEGSGEYGASRGKRLHNGVDYVCEEGQPIVAPFDMRIVRESIPRIGSRMSGIAWQRGKSSGRMWYFLPIQDLIGEKVLEGQMIGMAQSVSMDYGLPGMIDHIHFQVNK